MVQDTSVCRQLDGFQVIVVMTVNTGIFYTVLQTFMPPWKLQTYVPVCFTWVTRFIVYDRSAMQWFQKHPLLYLTIIYM